MLPPDLLKLLGLTAGHLQKLSQAKSDPLRTELSDTQYADWFLGDKLDRGGTNPEHFLNDFVLFRVACRWPRNANSWVIDARDIVLADFTLTDIEANDLVSMAREGLTDGYTASSWYAKVAAMRYIVANEVMPEILFEYLQEAVFAPSSAGSGRKKTDGMDRDRIIRNLVEGLLARNLGEPAALSNARSTASAALGRKGIGITEDGVRKACDRSIRTNRETRLWALLIYGETLESNI